MENEDGLFAHRCSDWMSELPRGLWDIPLRNLALPGSHDTMTYCLDQKSSVLQSEPKVLQVLDTLLPCVVRPCIMKWATSQEESICNQLDSGMRFLDLRIAHKTKDPDKVFYFAHGIYSLVTVKEALTEVAHWLDQHSKEVVIMAFSAFDGMNLDQHKDLIQFLITTFDQKICPNSVTPSLRECWNRAFQVILSYDDSAASVYEELWPKFDYWWANTSDSNRVISYLDERKEEGRPAGFFAAGLNLTEDAGYILSHPCQSLKGMTLSSCGPLMDWVKQQRPGSGSTCINVICADFVSAYSNEFTRLVIGLNQILLIET
ncbi:PI-PLC X domain-containing protein 1 [Triplophysa rosa]|uniref:PI-PLC X domain-containing protein 1 n=1 Tax=Triplophysa rosa TaxID=992332 RepID=A0A9W8C5K8_TRIRA|nr:PI-PLC X domain-containing protein 1 [Triplophysa rosa]KAI7807985.1 PI-PLC X domain-containing protein 1 [Triplophysa rosa]